MRLLSASQASIAAHEMLGPAGGIIN